MTPTITYVNGSVLPRAPHRWLAGEGPCTYCGCDEGEPHRTLGCPAEVCPQCREAWIGCACRTVDVIPRHGRLARPQLVGRLVEFEDGEGRPYWMRTIEEEEG